MDIDGLEDADTEIQLIGSTHLLSGDTIKATGDPRVDGRNVLKKTWEAFYEWDRKESQDLIDSLSITYFQLNDSSGSSAPLSSVLLEGWEPYSDKFTETGAKNPKEPFYFDSFDDDGNPSEGFSLFSEPSIALRLRSTKEYPVYFACAPTTRNILAEETDATLAKFIPFSDDPNFKIETFLVGWRDGLAWREDFISPDGTPLASSCGNNI